MLIRILSIIFLLSPVCSFGNALSNPQATDPVKIEQVLYRSNGGDPASLDPHKSVGFPDYMITSDLFEGLVTFDAKGEIIPGVAYKWTVSSDGLKWTFHLRKEAQWSNGDPVTAQDFVYSFRRFLNPVNNCRSTHQLSEVKNARLLLQGDLKDMTQLGVKALNDHTLQIQLENPVPYFLDILARGRGFPVHQKTIEKYGDFWALPGKMVCNGPFVLVDWKMSQYLSDRKDPLFWEVNDYLKLSKNPFYWDKQTLKLDHVYVLFIANELEELKLFRKGKIHLTHYNLQSPSFLSFVEENEPGLVRISPDLYLSAYIFGMEREVVKDKRIREAINLSIDREILAEKILFPGTVKVAYNFSVPGLKNRLENHIQKKDMNKAEAHLKARQLYKEAGYSKSRPLRIVLNLPDNVNSQKIALAVKEMLKEVLGAEVILNAKEFRVHASQAGQDTYDLIDMSWAFGYNDIGDFLKQFSTDTEKPNVALYSNETFDKLLKQANQIKDFSQRDKVLDKACKILFENEVVIPLLFHAHTRLISPQVQGFYENSSGVHPSRYMSLDTSKQVPNF